MPRLLTLEILMCEVVTRKHIARFNLCGLIEYRVLFEGFETLPLPLDIDKSYHVGGRDSVVAGSEMLFCELIALAVCEYERDEYRGDE